MKHYVALFEYVQNLTFGRESSDRKFIFLALFSLFSVIYTTFDNIIYVNFLKSIAYFIKYFSSLCSYHITFKLSFEGRLIDTRLYDGFSEKPLN